MIFIFSKMKVEAITTQILQMALNQDYRFPHNFLIFEPPQTKTVIQPMRLNFSITVLLLAVSFTSQASGQWKLIKEKQGIKIFSRVNDSKLIEIKAESSSEASLSSFVALMNDVDNFNNWMHAAEKTDLIERQGPYSFTYYMLNDLPWPAQDRDVILRLRIHKNGSKREVYTKSQNVDGVVREKDGIHRIESVRTTWRFVQEKQGNIKIVFRTRVKPKVQLPEWLANHIYQIGPYHTIINMKEMVQNEKYRNARVDIDQLN
jgi:hypothetical protein